MPRQSDQRKRRRSRISATQASRSFSTILDEIERGATYLIRRRGKDVCVMTSPTVLARKASKCVEILRGRGPVTLDDRFGADLLGIIAAEPIEDPTVGLLIDSTVFILAERERQTPSELIAALLERFGDRDLALSVMSAGELFHGCCRADTPRRRARREDFVGAVMAAVPAIPITLPVMRIFGRLDADLAAGGERLPTSDLLIASTALSRDDEIVTGNLRHFRRIPDLTVHAYS